MQHSLDDIRITERHTKTATGMKQRLRRGLFGQLIVEVEIVIERWDTDSGNLIGRTTRWRDADVSDFEHLDFPQEIHIVKIK